MILSSSLSNNELVFLITWMDLSSNLFVIGLLGVWWNRRNFVILLVSLELMFFAISLNFVFFGLYTNVITGQKYALFIISIAAAESAVGLSLLVVSYRVGKKIACNLLKSLRG